MGTIDWMISEKNKYNWLMGYNYYLLKLINGITGNTYRNDRVKEIDLRTNKKELVYMNASIETEMELLGLLRHLQGEE